jgi:hypothetical protein
MMIRVTMVGLAIVSSLLSSACGDETVTAPSTVTSPTTVSWTTLVGPGGTASRSFTATQAGVVTLTLTNAAFPLEIGIGVPRSSGSGCLLSASVTATQGSSPQLTASVEQGNYCVKVYDAGVITDPIPFTMQIVYP